MTTFWKVVKSVETNAVCLREREKSEQGIYDKHREYRRNKEKK